MSIKRAELKSSAVKYGRTDLQEYTDLDQRIRSINKNDEINDWHNSI